jgi:hypothetical protein
MRQKQETGSRREETGDRIQEGGCDNKYSVQYPYKMHIALCTLVEKSSKMYTVYTDTHRNTNHDNRTIQVHAGYDALGKTV